MKKPFLHALGAALYIVVIVLVINSTSFLPQKENETIIAPMVMLSLLVLSVAVMGFLFLSEPIRLLIENRKQEAFAFFGKVIGFFACFVVVFAAILLIQYLGS